MNKLFDKFTNSYIGLTILVIGSILVGATILIFPERVPLSITIAGIHYFLLAFMFGKAIYYKYQPNRINVINDTVMYDGELINLNEAKDKAKDKAKELGNKFYQGSVFDYGKQGHLDEIAKAKNRTKICVQAILDAIQGKSSNGDWAFCNDVMSEIDGL